METCTIRFEPTKIFLYRNDRLSRVYYCEKIHPELIEMYKNPIQIRSDDYRIILGSIGRRAIPRSIKIMSGAKVEKNKEIQYFSTYSFGSQVITVEKMVSNRLMKTSILGFNDEIFPTLLEKISQAI